MASRGSSPRHSPPPPHSARSATTTPTTSSTSISPSPATTTTTTTNRESFLSRKKKEIVDRSMAHFRQRLDRCLENSVSAAAAATAAAARAAGAGGGGDDAGGVVVRRRVKRGREEEEEDDGSVGPPAECGGDVDGGVGDEKERGRAVGGKAVKKKKVNPKAGRRFACPFSKHDPARFKSVKTCCGPGWEDVHRVKEHIYRRHSLKNFCPRCFEHFEKPEALKSHQRADVPCRVREPISGDTVTEEQEKQLHTRAKANSSEKDKWEDMYRVIFPNEKVPSPYYDTDPSAPSKPKTSQFQSLEECRTFLSAELPRLVRPAMEQYVNELFEEMQEKVDRKAVEIIREVENKVLYTFCFHEDQSARSATPGLASQGQVQAQGLLAAVEPSPPPSPGPELDKVSALFDELRDDKYVSEVFAGVRWDLETHLQEDYLALGLGGCESFSVDSAYGSGLSNGGYGVGGEYAPRY